MPIFELARRVCFMLRSAADGRGGPEMLEAATRVMCLFQKIPMLTPEQIEAARVARMKALKHLV